jgi:hypothetical protein
MIGEEFSLYKAIASVDEMGSASDEAYIHLPKRYDAYRNFLPPSISACIVCTSHLLPRRMVASSETANHRIV